MMNCITDEGDWWVLAPSTLHSRAPSTLHSRVILRLHWFITTFGKSWVAKHSTTNGINDILLSQRGRVQHAL